MQLPQRFALVLLLLVFTSSCEYFSGNKTATSIPFSLDLAGIKERGYITALVDNNSFSYFIYKGRSMGFEYELLKRLAQHLEVELRSRVTSGVERAMDQLNKGEGDILAFPLTITKARTEKVLFTSPQFDAYQVLVQRKPDN